MTATLENQEPWASRAFWARIRAGAWFAVAGASDSDTQAHKDGHYEDTERGLGKLI